MSLTVLQQIEHRLNEQGIVYDVLRHEPVYTSAEAAAVRGAPLCSGAKALICKCDATMAMFVLPADLRLASKQIRREKNYRKLRFATPEEVWDLTQLKPGSIPPFGSLFELPTFCDGALSENNRINFNAGDHSVSISMLYADYLKVEHPEIVACGEPSLENERRGH